MPAASPQAQLPQFRSSGDALAAMTQAQRLNIDAPSILTGNASAQDAFADDPNVAYRAIQNVGTTPVNVCINTNATANIAHFVLAGGTSDFDGLGSEKDLSVFRGRVSIYGAAAYKVAVTQGKFPLTTV